MLVKCTGVQTEFRTVSGLTIGSIYYGDYTPSCLYFFIRNDFGLKCAYEIELFEILI